MKFNTTDNVESPKILENGNQNIPVGHREPSKHFLKRLLQNPCDEGSKSLSYVTLILIALVVWALLYTLLHQEVEPPGGQLFILIALTGLSYFCGWLISFLYLPPLLGMLLCGIAMRNLGFFHVTGIYADIVVTIREVALTAILILAGLGLDASALKRLSMVVTRLALIPCFAEALGAALAAYFVMEMPWIWGLLLGFELSAVSPAIVIPALQSIKEKGYGESKGISTLIIAASSVDDIVCISIFGVLLGLIFSEGDLLSNIIHGPTEVAIGIVVGLCWGFITACIPHRNENYVTLKRSLMVGAGGLVFVLGGQMIGYSGAGPLAAIISSFLASLSWKWQGWSNTHNPVEDVFSNVWTIVEPLLLGLIGTEINFADIGLDSLWQALAVLGICSIGRIIACSVVVLGANLNFKEIIFVNLAWLPKATVQAALGPVALDLANRSRQQDSIQWAQDVLTIVVLSILITAPIGAIGITIGGPRLLPKNQPVSKAVENGNSRVVEVGNVNETFSREL
ncbi:sodium/hydrogen exchanger 9B2-like isoform X4 [Planococcus citri]|uniref:sodium/hydrogen exchanger 9B2-like isoform X4 n=1 Tax=Planococcus citri TaxID=170843 RepID=UPI0031F765C1